jgi:hypothetical protein
MARVRLGYGMAGQNYCVIGDCLFFSSLCRRGFQDLLRSVQDEIYALRKKVMSLILYMFRHSVLLPCPASTLFAMITNHFTAKRVTAV